MSSVPPASVSKEHVRELQDLLPKFQQRFLAVLLEPPSMQTIQASNKGERKFLESLGCTPITNHKYKIASSHSFTRAWWHRLLEVHCVKQSTLFSAMGGSYTQQLHPALIRAGMMGDFFVDTPPLLKRKAPIWNPERPTFSLLKLAKLLRADEAVIAWYPQNSLFSNSALLLITQNQTELEPLKAVEYGQFLRLKDLFPSPLHLTHGGAAQDVSLRQREWIAWLDEFQQVASSAMTRAFSKLLSRVEVSKLLLAPPAGLRGSPLHIVKLNFDSPEMLCQRYCCAYTPSLEDCYLLEVQHARLPVSVSQPPSALLLSSESADTGLLVPQEMTVIQQLFKSHQHGCQSATNVVEAFDTATVRAVPRFVSFHTHGVMDLIHPDDSRLYFRSGNSMPSHDFVNWNARFLTLWTNTTRSWSEADLDAVADRSFDLMLLPQAVHSVVLFFETILCPPSQLSPAAHKLVADHPHLQIYSPGQWTPPFTIQLIQTLIVANGMSDFAWLLHDCMKQKLVIMKRLQTENHTEAWIRSFASTVANFCQHYLLPRLKYELDAASAIGFADWQSLRTALCVSFVDNDELLVKDVLEGVRLPGCRVAALWACDTGDAHFVPDPVRNLAVRSSAPVQPNVLDFPSSFLLAGCSSVISSMWSAHDVATAMLSTSFFEFLLQDDNLSVANALQSSQRHVAKHRTRYQLKKTENELGRKFGVNVPLAASASDSFNFTHVFFWASFVITGTLQSLRADKLQSASLPQATPSSLLQHQS